MEMTNTDIAAHMQVMLISDQNDSVRKALICDEAMLQNAGRGLRCKVMLTSGISGDTPEFCVAVMKAVGEFDAFTEDNDPHGEHDFASVEVEGQTVFWKIDYKVFMEAQPSWITIAVIFRPIYFFLILLKF